MNPNNSASWLPEDIINVLLSYLNPKITTVLDKKIRDRYFQKHGIMLDYMSENIFKIPETYPIVLRYYVPIEKTNGLIKSRVVAIEKSNIIDLEEMLVQFPNLKRISNCVMTPTEKNIRALPEIKNDIVINIRTNEDLEIYKNNPNTNLISISFASRFLAIDGIEHLIYSMSSQHMNTSKYYPNLKIYTDDLFSEWPLEFNKAPNIEILIPYSNYVIPDAWLGWMKNKNSKYLVMPSANNRDYSNYRFLSNYRICYRVFQEDTMNQLIELEEKYRANLGLGPRKTLLIINRNFDYSPAAELFDIEFYFGLF